MFLVKLAFKNLTRNKRRTIITALVITFAVIAFLLLDSLLLGMMDKSLNNVINLESGHLQVVNSAYWEEKEEMKLENLISLTSELEEEIRKTVDFKGLAPQLNFNAWLNNGVNELPVAGKGVIPAQEEKVFTLNKYFAVGSMFSAGDHKAVIGKELADLMKLKVGDYITLLVRTKEKTFNTINAQICGLVETPNPNINKNLVYVPLELAQQALNLDNKVSQIVIKLEDRNQAKKAAASLSALFKVQNKDLQAYPWQEAAEQLLVLEETQQGQNQMIMGVILLIATLGVINTIILAALERVEEVGMMKALGLTEWGVVITFALESVGIAVIGGGAGCLLSGIGIGLLKTYGVDFFTLWGAEVDFGIPLVGRIYGVWNFKAFVFVFVYVVIVSFLVSIPPARWAAKKDPVKAIYHR